MQKMSAHLDNKQKSFVPKKNSGIIFQEQNFLFLKIETEIFSIFMIQDFVKPHKVSVFYLDTQKSFVSKKKVRDVSNQDFKMQDF